MAVWGGEQQKGGAGGSSAYVDVPQYTMPMISDHMGDYGKRGPEMCRYLCLWQFACSPPKSIKMWVGDVGKLSLQGINDSLGSGLRNPIGDILVDVEGSQSQGQINIRIKKLSRFWGTNSTCFCGRLHPLRN